MTRTIAAIEILIAFLVSLVALAALAALCLVPAHAVADTPPAAYPPVDAQVQAWCESEGGCIWASREALKRMGGATYDEGFKDGRHDGDQNCPSRVDFRHRYGDFMR